MAIAVSQPKEDSKRIWDQLEAHLPLFDLFQSDRSSLDSDGEVQNPMEAAIQAALAEMQEEITAIQDKMREKAVEIAKETYAALTTIDPNLAKAASADSYAFRQIDEKASSKLSLWHSHTHNKYNFRINVVVKAIKRGLGLVACTTRSPGK